MELNVQSTHNGTQVSSQEIKSNKKSELFFNIVNKKSDSTENNTVKINKQERTTSSSESQRDITDDKYYKNAPEFKAFIQKWIDKGHSEMAAIARADAYARAGLLDYGDQTLTIIENLGYGDKKQHGMHLVNNDVLKNAMIETFDSLDNQGVGVIVERLFTHDKYLNPDNNKNHESIVFQELIDEFSSKLNAMGGLNGLDNKKYTNYRNMNFDGNINITSQMTQHEKNYTNNVLVEYLKEHINQISQIEAKYNEPWEGTKESLNTLLHNFEKEIEKDNENYKVLNEYTKNSRANILSSFAP